VYFSREQSGICLRKNNKLATVKPGDGKRDAMDE
jgi:hypothetical protein